MARSGKVAEKLTATQPMSYIFEMKNVQQKRNTNWENNRRQYGGV